jgi:hypothetical protein
MIPGTVYGQKDEWTHLDAGVPVMLLVDELRVCLWKRGVPRLVVLDSRGRVLLIPHGSEQWPPTDLLEPISGS